MAVPGFLLEVDAVAAIPQVKGTPDRYARVLFTETTMDIAKSVAVDDLIYLAGMEGVDFANKGAVSPNVLDQVEVAVKKIDDTLRQSGLSIASMVKHKLYVKKGQDAAAARDAFHKAAIRLAPALAKNPSAETVIVVEGLAGERLLFEASVIASRSK
jgi:enamine deaminase RidA (YjgF/YER057c/UK114 family)